MPKFVKEILREGEYLVSTASGSRKKRKFTPEDLAKYADTATKMLENGLKIPAPRQHTLDAKPEVEEANPNGKYENFGFWEKFYVGETADGRDALYGVLDAPGDRDDPNTPAGKVAKVVQDVSICVHDFEDGKGRKWENALWHVALPTHPVEPDQKNFEPLPDDYDVVMMSQIVSNVDIQKLLTALVKCGISLPSDTTEDNLLDRLYVAVTQKSEGSDSGSLNSKPSGTKVENYPIMMALSQQQVEAILSANVVDPSTGKPFTKDAFADDGNQTELEKSRKSVVMMSNMLNKSYKERYSDRVRSLIASGRTTEEYAKATLYPLIESLDIKQAIQMGLNDDGSLPSNAVEITLQALEALPATKTPSGSDGDASDSLWMSRKPAGGSSVPNPSDVADINDEDAQSLIDQLIKA